MQSNIFPLHVFLYLFFILPSGKLLSSQSLIEKLSQSFRFFFQYFQDIFVKMACVLGGVAELIGFLAVVHDVEAERGLAGSFDPVGGCIFEREAHVSILAGTQLLISVPEASSASPLTVCFSGLPS